MKKIIICLIAILLSLVCACGQETASANIGEPIFSSFSSVDMNGNAVDENIFSDRKLTMVNIWGTFCGPCIAEMPDLGALNSAFGDDFKVVGIPIDIADRNGLVFPDKKSDAIYIINATGADYMHILPSPSLQKAYLSEVQSVPQTIFVDCEGRQVGEICYGAKSRAEWKNIIENLLESMP